MADPNQFSVDTIVKVSPQQVSADLAGEAAILNLDSGVYYGLNKVGAFIWNKIQMPTRVGDIYDAVFDEFEVEWEQCRNDVDHLLQKLANEGLIVVEDEVLE